MRQEFPEATILRPATFFGHEDHFLNYYACELLQYSTAVVAFLCGCVGYVLPQLNFS